MSPEHTEQLFTTFPHLYRGRFQYRDIGMIGGIGFNCGDGWFCLIWRLSRRLERAADEAGIDPKSDDWPEVVQVKSKFGTLRVNLRRSSPAFALLRNAALDASASICEECGRPTPEHDATRGEIRHCHFQAS